MKRIVPTLAAPLVATLTLAACATAPTPTPAIAPPAHSSQAEWDAGQAAWLAWNAPRRGWTTTASGLQYRREGAARPDAPRPSASDTVRVHYEGTFIDGRKFDSSYDRGEPAEFPLNRVIAGWTEGVALMHVGETFHFAIPASLGYGARWVGGDEIPPNSTLLFKVELLEVR
jgi:FKBP-type peptidyl-prolyl cis-trans isomerase